MASFEKTDLQQKLGRDEGDHEGDAESESDVLAKLSATPPSGRARVCACAGDLPTHSCKSLPIF